jgi:hypothetical protein
VGQDLPRPDRVEHVFLSDCTPEGTFTYTPTLTRFTLRRLLTVSEASAAEADEAAVVEGELLATDFLVSRGITHKPLAVTAVCLDDVKVRRRPSRA